MILEVPGSITAPDAITGIIARLIAVFFGAGIIQWDPFLGGIKLDAIFVVNCGNFEGFSP